MGPIDGVKVFVESSVTCNHVENDSVAHLVVDEVAVNWLITDSSLDPMVESVLARFILIHSVLSRC